MDRIRVRRGSFLRRDGGAEMDATAASDVTPVMMMMMAVVVG